MSTFDLPALVAEGFVFSKTNEWNVTTPAGRHGAGATPEEAVLNVGAQILHDPEHGRKLVRENGEVIYLDKAVVDPDVDAENEANRPAVRAAWDEGVRLAAEEAAKDKNDEASE